MTGLSTLTLKRLTKPKGSNSHNNKIIAELNQSPNHRLRPHRISERITTANVEGCLLMAVKPASTIVVAAEIEGYFSCLWKDHYASSDKPVPSKTNPQKEPRKRRKDNSKRLDSSRPKTICWRRNRVIDSKI